MGIPRGFGGYHIPSVPVVQNVAGAQETINSSTTFVHVTSAATSLSFAAVSAMRIGQMVMIEYHGTSPATIELVPTLGDRIEGAKTAALYGYDILAALVPFAANRFALMVWTGVGMWLHCSVDLTAVAGAAPWTIPTNEADNTVWTDNSTATNSVAASTGIQFTSGTINQSYFASSLGASVSSPISAFLDGWDRPLTPNDDFWFLLNAVKSATVVNSDPQLSIVLTGSAISSNPRAAATNPVAGNVGVPFQVNVKGSGSNVSVSYPSLPYLTASFWMGMRFLGSENRIDGAMSSSVPVGSPGVLSGWYPTTYDAPEGYRALGEAYCGDPWDKSTMGHIRLVQTIDNTLGSKFTAKNVAIIMSRRGPQ